MECSQPEKAVAAFWVDVQAYPISFAEILEPSLLLMMHELQDQYFRHWECCCHFEE